MLSIIIFIKESLLCYIAPKYPHHF